MHHAKQTQCHCTQDVATTAHFNFKRLHNPVAGSLTMLHGLQSGLLSRAALSKSHSLGVLLHAHPNRRQLQGMQRMSHAELTVQRLHIRHTDLSEGTRGLVASSAQACWALLAAEAGQC